MPEAFPIPEPAPLNQQTGALFAHLVALMRRLLAPDGCPWDREQSIESLRQYVLEEACEVLDAIDSGDRNLLQEELGDLALQIAFISELARREGRFGPDDVMRGIVAKLVRRHPHVFGSVEVGGSDEVIRNWDAIKATEKTNRPLLDDIPRALPALMGAERVSARVAKVGFDWPDASGSRDKVSEELQELDEAVALGDPEQIEAELGDVLFALVNLARHHGVDAERALGKTSARFRARFGHVEARVRDAHGDWPRDERGKPTRGLTLEELDLYWEEAKLRTR
jgi:tetrapyrrole methylase family protein/MazG family protein/ATP diphosphatase